MNDPAVLPLNMTTIGVKDKEENAKCAFDVSQICIHLVSYRQEGKAHQAASVLKGCDSVGNTGGAVLF